MNTINNIQSQAHNDFIIACVSNTITDMFEKTDTEGTLCISAWPYDNAIDDKSYYRCTMNWTAGDIDDALNTCKNLCIAFKEISENWEKIYSEKGEKSLSEHSKHVWNKYIRDFEVADFDMRLISNVSDKYETIEMAKSIKKRMSANEEVSDMDVAFYFDNKDIAIASEEKSLYAKYQEAVNADAERRIGDNIAAYDVIIRAKRLCKLMALHAPVIIIENEARLFAQAFAIHYYCGTLEIIEDEIE